MFKKIMSVYFLPFFFITATTLRAEVIAQIDTLDDHTKIVHLSIPVKEGDLVYSDYLAVSVDDAHIECSDWQANSPIFVTFDPVFNKDKKAFKGDAKISFSIQSKKDFNECPLAKIHVNYYLKSLNTMVEEVIPLTLLTTVFPNPALETQIDIPSQDTVETKTADAVALQPEAKQPSFIDRISRTIENSNSLALRLLLVFLLGLLMSLTPCIYPMVPITAGILQSQSSKSLVMSFLLALTYTVGIATTFATLGLLAAFAGQAMGSLMYQPLFIIPLVAILIYLALAMIGVYDMYIPQFAQPRNQTVQGGSFVSVFMFGALSGLIASPCLSPGLVCLLCLVTTLGSKLMGFILLFFFGIGLSVPLLIIGTFSNSLSLLPRAGMWMVEIKKAFGYLMLAMCFYFLDPILPWEVKAILIPLFIAVIGLLYLHQANSMHKPLWRIMANLVGIALIAGSVFAASTSYLAWKWRKGEVETFWKNDYAKALTDAQTLGKNVFLDIGAPYCSICKSIDKTLFADKHVQVALTSRTIPVKIDGSKTENAALLKQFNVLGFPTILLVNPETQQVIKQWGPELYDTAHETFAAEIYQSK